MIDLIMVLAREVLLRLFFIRIHRLPHTFHALRASQMLHLQLDCW